jgi:hypothetical protein
MDIFDGLVDQVRFWESEYPGKIIKTSLLFLKPFPLSKKSPPGEIKSKRFYEEGWLFLSTFP